MPTRKNLNGQTSHTVDAESAFTATIPDAESAPVKPSRSRKASPPVETPTKVEPTAVPKTPRTRAASKPATPKRKPIKMPIPWSRNAKGRWQRIDTLTVPQLLAVAIGAVVCGLLSLSLSHVAEAIAFLTHTDPSAAWWIALAIDAGMVLCELGVLFGSDDSTEHCEQVVAVGISLSMLLNVVAFCHHTPWIGWHATGFTYVCDVIIGVTIPGLIWLLCQAAGRLARQ